MLGRWAIVYLDDILIYSDTFDSHVQHVRAVLKCLIDHQLYAKMEKCEFHQTLTSFLGYIISADGVAMDEKKINSVLNWPTPKTTKDLQRFLGFANFYRRFIRNFSTIAAPLTSLLMGGKRYLSGPQQHQRLFSNLRSVSPPHQFFIIPILNSNSRLKWMPLTQVLELYCLNVRVNPLSSILVPITQENSMLPKGTMMLGIENC